MGAMNAPCSPELLVEHLPATGLSLRVALVTETYPPEINGVSLSVSRLAQALQARGHRLQLIRPRQTLDAPEHRHAHPRDLVLVRGLPIPRYPNLRMGLPAKSALVRLWSAQRPDVVHIATEGPLGWSALQAARKLRLPISTDFRTHFDAYSTHYGLGWLRKPIAAYLRKFHNLGHVTLVPTAALAQRLAAHGFQRLQVVARGVDAAGFHPRHRSAALRAEWGAADDRTVALYVGRLAPEKNLALLAQAFNAMQQANPALVVVVVGDGPGRADLQAACPGARLVGSRTGADLAAHYASADCLVFPSLTETYGNVTPEALASGLAVLAFDQAAARELIHHGDNGLLAPAGDADAFLRHAVTLARTAPLVQRLRQAAPAAVAQRGWGPIAQHMEAVWLQHLQALPAPTGPHPCPTPPHRPLGPRSLT